MAKYTNEQLLQKLEEEGVDISRFEHRGGTESEGGHEHQSIQPVQIMNIAAAQGIHVPWEKVVPFILCVLKGIMTQPLPAAVTACAKDLVK